MSAIDRMAVVIPARNEEAALGSCLRSVTLAQQRIQRYAPDVRSIVVLVLDRCTDGSAAVAADFPSVEVVQSTAGQVGAARHLGVGHALRTLPGPTRTCWIAGTDADSQVPPSWLVDQLTVARRGAHLVLGCIEPDRNGLSDNGFEEWLSRNPPFDGHPYVHGANLGIRADMYLRAGGYPRVAEHEDVMLAAAVRRLGGAVVSTATNPVVTSSRIHGRTPGGFAGYLAALTL